MTEIAGKKPGVNKRKKRKNTAASAAAAAASGTDTGSPGAHACGVDAGGKPSLQQDDTIDSIFAGCAAKAKPPASKAEPTANAAQKKTHQSSRVPAKASKQPSAAVKGSKDDLFDEGPSQTRRQDGEGLPIYTTEELKVGSGGDTAACPFDCECCF